MLKSIKKLFAIDESEVDIDEIDTEIDDKRELYKKQMAQSQSTNITPVFPKIKKPEVDDDARYTEIKVPEPEANTDVIALEEIKEIQENTKAIVDESEISKTSRRNFDFEQVIEKSYEPREQSVNSTVEKTTQSVIKEPKRNDEYSRDNYVLKDLISPMRGVVRKEKPTPRKVNEHKKANIIKLREEVKTTELDFKDDYKELMEYPFDSVSDTKDLESSLNQLTKEEVKDTLSETSRFTLIEDSTGEMRLVIDEDDNN